MISSLVIVLGNHACVSPKQVETVPEAPRQYRRPEAFQPFNHTYSLEALKNKFSEEHRKAAAVQYQKVTETNTNGKWAPTPASIDSHNAPEWFLDAKFGMFVDWGLWAIAGWAPKKEEGAMYPDWYEFRLDTDSVFMKYHEKNWGEDVQRDDFIPLFTANSYQPKELVDVAVAAGMKYVIPFSKHHSGFCLWPSSFTQRDVADMAPGRDLIEPLVANCREQGLKFGFYFSIEEWEYPVIGKNGEIVNRLWGGKTKPYTADLEKKASGKIAVNSFDKEYLIPQATEFIDRYDPDILWYDADWNTHVDSVGTYEIAAYFYNNADGRKEVAVNDRYAGREGERWQRSKRGDFFTNEYDDMKDQAVQTIHPWEECRGISQSFGFNWQDTEDNVISSKDFIDMFVEIVSKGGNLLLIVNLDGQGALPEVQRNRLTDIGRWLHTNGEGIYATRPYQIQSEGAVSYTQSKDRQYVYAILKDWPNEDLLLTSVRAASGSSVHMLGYDREIEWENTTEGIRIKLPEQLKQDKNRPCEHAWVFKIKL